jgi:beta-phosphoglucomutase-like phosphatase (HAD superfamily)
VAALDVHPSQAVALEDSPNGIAAAKDAGLRCVAVPNALTRGLDVSRADVRLSSLAEMPLERLLAVLSAR